MVLLHFGGPRAPLATLGALQVTYFFASRNQHYFRFDVCLKMAPFGEPFWLQKGEGGLSRGGPGTDFGHFGARRGPKTHFELMLELILRNVWSNWVHVWTCFGNFRLPNRNVEQVTSKHQPGKQEYNQTTRRSDETARRNARSD